MNKLKFLTTIATTVVLLLIGIVTVVSAQYDYYDWAPFAAIGGL